ncbi:MAG: hypothetical protein P8J87_06780 [Verrucomicrobiales bacterium]|nr:hypothetical protein [Verrucomicrobiales bacterium]
MTATNTFTFEQDLQEKAATQPKASSSLQTVFTVSAASSIAAVIYFVATNLLG